MLKRFFAFCAVAVLAGNAAFGWWEAVESQDKPPALFSVTGVVATAGRSSVRGNRDAGTAFPRSGAQTVLEKRLPPTDGLRIAELARSLGHDWRRCFRFVRDHVAYVPCFGFLRGAERTLLDMEGGDGDQSLLLLELLRACGHSNAKILFEPCSEDSGFIVPLHSHEGQLPYNAAAWFGLDESIGDDAILNEVWMRLSTMRSPVKYFFDPTQMRHYIKTSRFWVSLYVDGETHDLDPAFKLCRYVSQRDFASDMGLTDVEGLSATNLEYALDGYCATLHGAWTNANVAASGYVGGCRIVATENDAPEFPGAILSGDPVDFALLQDAEKNRFRAEVSARLGEGTFSFFLDEIGAGMLWIAYDGDPSSPFATLRLDDTVLASEVRPSGTSATLQMVVSYTNVSTSASYSLGRSISNAFAVVSGFGADDSAVRRVAAEGVAAAHSQGTSADSPAFIARTSRVLGQNWISQCGMLEILANRRPKGFCREFYSIGVAGGGVAPYVDMKNAISGAHAAPHLFPAFSFMRSALEHSVLEQVMGTNVQAVSTVKALSLAVASGMAVHHVDKWNFDSVTPWLSGYSVQQTDSLRGWTDAGYTLLLPNSPVSLNDWQGIVFAAMKLSSNETSRIAMVISGGLAGGYCTEPCSATADGCANASLGVTAVQRQFAEAQAADPVAMPSLAFCDAETDLSLRGGSSLAWARTYDSRSRNVPGALGRGWTHSFDASVRETSDPDSAFGGGSVDAVIPTAVALTVIEKLLARDAALQETELARRHLLAALAADWWTRRITSAAVAVSMGARSLLFHRRTDGSYAPPPGVTASLARTGEGGWRLAERNGNAYSFDASGSLASISDISGNATCLSYSDGGRLLCVSNGFGRTFVPSWDGGHIASVTDSAGRMVRYSYDEAGCLTNVTDAAGMDWWMEYDPSNGSLVSRFSPDGAKVLRNAYNAFGQVTNQTAASGGTWSFGAACTVEAWDEDPLGHRRARTFDSDGSTISSTDRNGAVSRMAYDGHGHAVTNVDAIGRLRIATYDGRDNLVRVEEGTGSLVRVTALAYDADDRLVAVTNGLGDVTEFSYDACGRLLRTLFADGTSVTNSWTANGLLLSRTSLDASGGMAMRTCFAYGSDGLPVSRTTSGSGLPTEGIVETFAWDAAGNLVSRTDGEGRTTTFGYDAKGREISRTDALGGVTAYAYSDSGWLTNVTDAVGRSTSFVRTPSGAVVATIFPDGSVSTNVYDAADRLLQAIDARGAAVALGRDAEGRVVSRTSPVGTSSVAYDLLGHPVASTNAAGETAAFAYDVLGNQTSATDGLGSTWETEHDVLGRLVSTRSPIGKMRQFGHDQMGRQAWAMRPSGAIDRFGYDAAGRLVAHTNAAGNVHTLVRDALGRVLSEIDGEGRTLFSAAYDNCGNMTNLVRGGTGTTGVPPVGIVFSYDALNRLVSRAADGVDERFTWSAVGELLTASNSVALETFSYDQCGRLSGASTLIGQNTYDVAYLRDSGGIATNISYGAGMSVSREYDVDGRLVAVRDSLGHEWTFSHDGEGKPLGGTSPDGRAHSFAYDAAGRLSSWSVVGMAGRSLERDAAGRLMRETVTSGAMPRPAKERRAHNTFDAAGRIVSADVECGTGESVHEVYLHDNCGAVTNVAADGETVFSARYDALGRLTGTTGVSPVASTYSYDALGNRIHADGRTFIPDHDDPLKRPLLECDDAGVPVRAYIWGAGRLLGWLDLESSNALTIAHCDDRGNVIALSSADGTILHTAHYGPHGEDWGITGENPTPFAWLGGLGVMRTDGRSPRSIPNPQSLIFNSSFSPLYLTRHRLYSPSLRRFLSSDPIGLSGGFNLYAYCSGDPLSYVDPLGLCGEDSWNVWIRVCGFFQMLGGCIEGGIGLGFAYATAPTVAGPALGIAVGMHGADVANAGFYTMWTGVPHDTLTSQGLQSLGLPQNAATGIDAGISIGTTWGVGASLRSAQTTTTITGPILSQESTTTLYHGGVLRGNKVSGPLCTTPEYEHALKYANNRADGLVYKFQIPDRVLNQWEVEGLAIKGLDSYQGVGMPAVQYEFLPILAPLLNSYMAK